MRLIQKRVQEGKEGTDLIIQTSVRFLAPFIQLFGLYVLVHGHYSPGGGFQGGVLLGTSFILLALAFGVEPSKKYMSERVNALLVNFGVLIFVGFGVLCALMGGFFLDYGAMDALVPLSIPEWRSLGVLIVEIGVALGVMGIMVSLYWDLSSGGSRKEGL